jgi:AcrR family transcriptional regulator
MARLATMKDKRQRILRAAEALFTGRRFHEITLDQVAARARVGKGTIYEYFQDKDDLFFQVLTSGFDELGALIRHRVPAQTGFAAQILNACREIGGFFERRQPLFRLMLSEGARLNLDHGRLHEQFCHNRRKLVEAVAEIIDRGVAEGAVRSDVPADVLASYLLGMLHARKHDLSDAPAASRRQELVVELFLHGAATPRAANHGATK